MSEARIAARFLVDALRRAAEAEGAQATVLVRGDPTSGSVILLLRERTGGERAYERTPAFAGPVRWAPIGPAEGDPAAYLARRRSSDPDLWVLEIAGGDDPYALVAGITGVEG